VTVCVVAIYQEKSIVGVSDRMLTSGDIQFEPQKSKIIPITTSIAVMTAGSESFHQELFSKVRKKVGEIIKSNPTKWAPVEDVANLYSKCFIEIKNKLSENVILSPFNLDHEKFIERQRRMLPTFVDKISDKLELFFTPNQGFGLIETIVSGIDDTGPHIFEIINDRVLCHDRIGFAAIGAGRKHAASHMMLSGHSVSVPEPKTLWNVYLAKKKAEISPGVGRATDMFLFGAKPGSFIKIKPIPGKIDILGDLDKFYKRYTKDIEKLDKKEEKKIKTWLGQLSKVPPPQPEEQSPSSSPSPSFPPPKAKSKS